MKRRKEVGKKAHTRHQAPADIETAVFSRAFAWKDTFPLSVLYAWSIV